MKKLLPGLMLLFSFYAFAQSTHTIDFEPAGTGSDWGWVVGDNDDNPPVEIIANPVSGGINTTPTVAKIIIRQNGAPWALCYTDDDGEFTFDATNSTVKIMVYKEVISNIAIKFEGLSPAAEIQIPNTITNQWEELTFDFSASIGNTHNRLIIIPDFDFDPRPQDNIIYFDNIQVPDGTVSPLLPEPTTVPPVPAHASEDVISLYTEVYSNLPGTDFNPPWGQSTTVTIDYLAAGNYTLKYENLNYQGTQYTNQDVSLFDYLHVDFWTPNSTDLNFYLISPGAETFFVLPITQETWVSVDIPLTDYVPPVNLSDVFQFKVTGNGVVYFDNWYFWKNPTAPGSDATLSDLQVDGSTVPGFSPTVLSYDVGLPYGTTTVPTVTAVTNDPGASYLINNAVSLPGTTQVIVTAENGTTTLTYNVHFSIDSPEPTTVPPTPPHAAADVLSIYSDEYSNLPGTNFNPWWGQQTIVTVDYLVAGNNTLRYENLNYQGTEFTSQDVSGYDYLHVDFWTSNSTDLGIYMISPGPTEKEYVFTIVPETWVSVDILLTDFAPPVNLSEVFQFKIEGNGDIWFDNLYFWKPSGSGTLTFNPENGATNVPITVHPALTFTLPVEMADGSTITNAHIPSIVTFNEENAGGQAVPFSGEINAEKTVITITPDSDLQYEQAYYLALNNEVIRYQGGDLISEQSVTFTTMPAPKPYLALDVQDNFEDDGFGTIESWMFQDGPDLVDLTITGDPLDPTNHVADYNRSGTFLFTNAQFILDYRLKLTQRNKFNMKVYFTSSNNYTGGLTPTAAIKLQNSLLGPDAYTTQTEIVQTITQFDEWVTLQFDFSAVADSMNYDQVVVQLGGENHNDPGQFYFDNFILKPSAFGILTNFNATPKSGLTPMPVQFTDLSMGNVSQWEWDFDYDGTIDSQDQNPVFVYDTPGTYTVLLRAGNPFASDELVKIDYIVVSELIEPSYIYTDFDENINVEFSGWPVVPEVVANPYPSGINLSATVGKLARAAEPYSNIFTIVDSTVNFSEDHFFKFSIYSPVTC
nr:Ig-like domain-containing protein [Bacteroidota bacterium]